MKSYVVIGLGRFGTAVATELCAQGSEVLAIDTDQANVQAAANLVTHAVVADARDPGVLRSLGVRNLDCAPIQSLPHMWPIHIQIGRASCRERV